MFLRLMLGGQSLLENGLSDGDDDDKEDDNDFIDDDDDDDDDEVHDDEGNDHGTVDDLDSNDTVDEEGKQPNSQQNARVIKQETRVLRLKVDTQTRWSRQQSSSSDTSKKLIEMFQNAGHTISHWMSVESILPLPSTRFQQ